MSLNSSTFEFSTLRKCNKPGSDFIHTNNFVLVDQKKRIRGYYDGTNEKEVTKLLGDISLLLDE